jgi:H+/gluconate symporter-like permease
MLVTIASFVLFLGVLVMMLASSHAPKDAFGQRIPDKRVRIVAIILMIGGAGLFGWLLLHRALR